MAVWEWLAPYTSAVLPDLLARIYGRKYRACRTASLNLFNTVEPFHLLYATVRLRSVFCRPIYQKNSYFTKHCDDVCISVCQCVCPLTYISKTTRPNFTFLCMLAVAVTRSSSGNHTCDTLCTSAFADDVMFSYSLMGPIWHIMCIPKHRKDITKQMHRFQAATKF